MLVLHVYFGSTQLCVCFKFLIKCNLKTRKNQSLYQNGYFAQKCRNMKGSSINELYDLLKRNFDISRIMIESCETWPAPLCVGGFANVTIPFMDIYILTGHEWTGCHAPVYILFSKWQVQFVDYLQYF